MTIKRRLFLLVIVVLAGIVGATVYSHASKQARIQQLTDVFAKIAIGMSKTEAETIIGRPPDYTGNYGITENRIDESWCIEGYRLDLELTRSQVVAKKHLSPLYVPGPIDRLREWFYGY